MNTEQRASEREIRALIERSAKAVQAGDLAGVRTRLRLTIGLRKEDGRWIVSHEHHSFPARD